MELHSRILTREELPGFRPYLLPATAAALEQGGGGLVAVGAVTGRHACGAACASLGDADDARLTDLFVDAAVRRQGVGTFLLRSLTERLAVRELTANYALGREDLAAMDAFLVRCGFSRPRLRARCFRALSDDYRQHPVLRQCFDPRYRTPEGVVSFDRLSREALEELEAARDIQDDLSWSHLKGRAVPELSVAIVRDGRVAAFQLAQESADGGFVLLSAVNRENAPQGAFLTLFVELGSRCVYHAGGSFPFYFSTINAHVEQLARWLMGGLCTEYEEHDCHLFLDGKDENFEHEEE